MESITSRTNPLITRIRKLTGDRKYRRREGVMVCEGPKMLAEALRWGAGLETILWQTGTHPPAGIPQGVRQVEVPGDLLRSVAPTETPQQVLFLARLPARALPEELTGSRYLVLDGLQDPGNLGTLWRTADAFGADGLLLLPGCADPGVPDPPGHHGGLLPPAGVGGKLEDLLPRLARAGLPCMPLPWGGHRTSAPCLWAGLRWSSAARAGGCRRRCWRPVKRPCKFP
ncbi:MAG: TrmH family RNA methyltransferase [Evtepia gabavorous]